MDDSCSNWNHYRKLRLCRVSKALSSAKFRTLGKSPSTSQRWLYRVSDTRQRQTLDKGTSLPSVRRLAKTCTRQSILDQMTSTSVCFAEYRPPGTRQRGGSLSIGSHVTLDKACGPELCHVGGSLPSARGRHSVKSPSLLSASHVTLGKACGPELRHVSGSLPSATCRHSAKSPSLPSAGPRDSTNYYFFDL